jgi:hypothetical protein
MKKSTFAACQTSYDRFVRDPNPDVEHQSRWAYIFAQTDVGRPKHDV